MTAQVIAWMTAVQALMTVAPDVVVFAAKVKGWIADMFSSGLITAEVQNKLKSRVDEICRAALSGETPKHWQVEANPVG